MTIAADRRGKVRMTITHQADGWDVKVRALHPTNNAIMDNLTAARFMERYHRVLREHLEEARTKVDEALHRAHEAVAK